MAPRRKSRQAALASCHGYLALTTHDELVGEVETAVFASGADEPDFLVLRTQGEGRARYPVVSTTLVERVNPDRRVVYLRATRDRIARLPEHLPVAV